MDPVVEHQGYTHKDHQRGRALEGVYKEEDGEDQASDPQEQSGDPGAQIILRHTDSKLNIENASLEDI